MIGRAGLFEHGVPIKFQMRRCVAAAMEGFLIGLLRTVIGKGLAWNLPARQTSAISERGQKDGVYRPALLEDVQDLIRSFIDERNGTDLEADGLRKREIIT